MKNVFKALSICSLLFFSLQVFAEKPVVKKKEKKQKFTWVLAHEPIGLFKEAADFFSKEVSEKTAGLVEIEVLTLPQYSAKYLNGKKVARAQFFKLIETGKITFSQNYTTDLGALDKDMYVLDMPFLFRDHEHAKRVLEGEIGEKLLSNLAEKKVRGLAFTYSGGNRILPSKVKIQKMEDFKGLRIRTSSSPVAQDTFEMLGAEPIPMALDNINKAMANAKIEAAESTYPRFFTMKNNEVSPYVVESSHSLFLTTILVNEMTWKKFSPEVKKIIKETAIAAARQERARSLEDTEKIRERCVTEGIKLVKFSPEEKQKMVDATKAIYKKYENSFSIGLVKGIQEVQ